MATTRGQLIPKWQHPSETTFIFDNTVVEDTENINISAVRMINVFMGPKGIDNKLLEKRGLATFVDEYGYPDYKRYGQAMYMPYTALASGFAHAWCMRIMPDDATYSNVIYAVKIKKIPPVKDTGGVDPEKILVPAKLSVKFEPFSQSNMSDAKMFETYMETLKKTDAPDSEGYITYPYIGFRMLGRGSYGQYFRARLSHDVSSDETNGYKNYNVALISTELGTKQVEAFSQISLVEDAIDPRSKTTIYIEDKVNDFEGDGSKKFAVAFKQEYHKAIFDFYKTEVDPNTHLTLETFDIFGYDRTTQKENPLIQVEGGIGSVALLAPEGVTLANGTDGKFSDATPAADKEQEAEKLYLKAYSGGIDPLINSKRRAPAHTIMDANFPLQVKKAIVALALKRMDAVAYIDSGLLTSTTDIIRYFSQLADVDTYMVSKNAGMFSTKDPNTNKNIPVTSTLWLAYKIPMHWQQHGMYTPMAAEDYATLSGYVRNSIRPEIDADDEETKEIFYKARWNYIECLGENFYVRGTQQTSQKALSDLSEENNVHVMLAMKNRLERLCQQKRYKFAEADDQKRYTEDAKELFSSWQGVYFRSFNIKFAMTKYEELRSILHCYLDIIFKTIVKRSLIEININPRA